MTDDRRPTTDDPKAIGGRRSSLSSFRHKGVSHGFARRVVSPKGFVKRAEGFSPAARMLRQPAAAGLKPSATTTKAACAACPQNDASHPRHNLFISPPGCAILLARSHAATCRGVADAASHHAPAGRRQLDRAVLDAYGWPHDIAHEEILARLLALNLERAAGQSSSSSGGAGGVVRGEPH
jgi:hypothetical protein